MWSALRFCMCRLSTCSPCNTIPISSPIILVATSHGIAMCRTVYKPAGGETIVLEFCKGDTLFHNNVKLPCTLAVPDLLHRELHVSRGIISMLSARSARSTPQQRGGGGSPTL